MNFQPWENIKFMLNVNILDLSNESNTNFSKKKEKDF